MSQRKWGEIVISIRGEREHPVRLSVSWTSRSDRNKQVEKVVTDWARNIWKNQGAETDVSLLDLDGPGKVRINGETEAVAAFRVELQTLSVPAPVPALFAAGSSR
ncbi:hypothetical protein CGQ24_08320 [Arthrobacter sp. 7749]|nr:hypothetical protein CGQ24_08320 [Arthrobacter sp. 7749]